VQLPPLLRGHDFLKFWWLMKLVSGDTGTMYTESWSSTYCGIPSLNPRSQSALLGPPNRLLYLM
jgi:hypothetical protein